MLARHRAHGFGIERTGRYTDGVVTGFGHDRRPPGVRVLRQDFTIFGGALGEVLRREDPQGHGPRRVDRRADHRAQRRRRRAHPGGRRRRSTRYGGIFFRNVKASGVIPQISVILGPCAGGAVYSPAMTDFIFMVKGTSHMFITGPDVVKTVTGEEVTLEELGGAMSHATKSGVATFVAADEQSCLEEVRYLLSFLPSNNLEEPPHCRVGRRPRAAAAPELVDLVPDVAEPALRHEEGHRRGRRRRRLLRGTSRTGR